MSLTEWLDVLGFFVRTINGVLAFVLVCISLKHWVYGDIQRATFHCALAIFIGMPR